MLPENKARRGSAYIILKYALLTLVSLFTLSGCNIGRHLPRGEKLFVGSQINLRTDSGTVKKDIEALQASLVELARPRPNKQILGFPYKVGLYYLFGEPTGEKGFHNWFSRKFGEPPVLASARTLTANANIFTGFVENEGYFASTVQGKYAETGYKAKAVYDVHVLPRFYFNEITFLSDSTPIGKALVTTARRTVMKAGDPYRFDNIKVEQERVGQALKQRGYYYFQPSYITFLADNDTLAHRTKLYIAIKPDIPTEARKPYYIRDVFIYPNYSLNNTRAVRDTNERLAYTSFNDLKIVDSSRRFDPKLFRDVISVLPGRRYNSRAQDITLSRLINVGTFKFVRNRFDSVDGADSSFLDVHYYLTPYPVKALQATLAGTSKSNNYTGANLVLSWRNRNLLRRAELLQFNLNTGIEFQVGAGSQTPISYRYGADITLTLPRLLSPFKINYDQRSILPKTNITLGYSLIVRSEFYNLSSSQLSLGYAFKTNPQTEISIQPLTITYVRTSNYGRLLDSLVFSSNQELSNQAQRIFDANQLILGTVISYNHTSPLRSNSPYTSQFTANLDFAGNLAGLLFNKRDVFGSKEIFGVNFAQYVRLDVDSRHYYRVTPNLTWASRLYGGFGLPYGNASTGAEGSKPMLPLVKQFFVGGSNSIRAFRPRAIGPGSYSRGNGLTALYFQDGGGDIKLEGNTELRQKFGKYLQGALFVDVGNVWTYADTISYGAGSKFSSQFAKQLAVGTGVGLRIDLSYFVVRFDLAFPLRKPYLPDGQRWVFKEIAFGSPEWRRDNLVLNIAIGYPF